MFGKIIRHKTLCFLLVFSSVCSAGQADEKPAPVSTSDTNSLSYSVEGTPENTPEQKEKILSDLTRILERKENEYNVSSNGTRNDINEILDFMASNTSTPKGVTTNIPTKVVNSKPTEHVVTNVQPEIVDMKPTEQIVTNIHSEVVKTDLEKVPVEKSCDTPLPIQLPENKPVVLQNEQKMHKEESQKLIETMSNMKISFDAAMHTQETNITAAINNNTMVIQKLIDKLEKDG